MASQRGPPRGYIPKQKNTPPKVPAVPAPVPMNTPSIRSSNKVDGSALLKATGQDMNGPVWGANKRDDSPIAAAAAAAIKQWGDRDSIGLDQDDSFPDLGQSPKVAPKSLDRPLRPDRKGEGVRLAPRSGNDFAYPPPPFYDMPPPGYGPGPGRGRGGYYPPPPEGYNYYPPDGYGYPPPFFDRPPRGGFDFYPGGRSYEPRDDGDDDLERPVFRTGPSGIPPFYPGGSGPPGVPAADEETSWRRKPVPSTPPPVEPSTTSPKLETTDGGFHAQNIEPNVPTTPTEECLSPLDSCTETLNKQEPQMSQNGNSPQKVTLKNQSSEESTEDAFDDNLEGLETCESSMRIAISDQQAIRSRMSSWVIDTKEDEEDTTALKNKLLTLEYGHNYSPAVSVSGSTPASPRSARGRNISFDDAASSNTDAHSGLDSSPYQTRDEEIQHFDLVPAERERPMMHYGAHPRDPGRPFMPPFDPRFRGFGRPPPMHGGWEAGPRGAPGFPPRGPGFHRGGWHGPPPEFAGGPGRFGGRGNRAFEPPSEWERRPAAGPQRTENTPEGGNSRWDRGPYEYGKDNVPAIAKAYRARGRGYAGGFGPRDGGRGAYGYSQDRQWQDFPQPYPGPPPFDAPPPLHGGGVVPPPYTRKGSVERMVSPPFARKGSLDRMGPAPPPLVKRASNERTHSPLGQEWQQSTASYEREHCLTRGSNDEDEDWRDSLRRETEAMKDSWDEEGKSHRNDPKKGTNEPTKMATQAINQLTQESPSSSTPVSDDEGPA